MDRQHRHDLKHDKFVDEIGALSDRARANQRGLLTIGIAIVVIAVITYGVFFFRGNRESKAQAELAKAIGTIESPLKGQATPESPAPANARFTTDAERSAAAEKEFQQVRANFSGTDAADVAGLYLARMAAARGEVPAARNMLQDFVDDHPEHFLVGGARYSLMRLRIDSGEAQQVVTEINAELAKAEPSLPGDALLSLLAHAYEVQNDAVKARETYRRIITEYPESPYVIDAQRRAGAV